MIIHLQPRAHHHHRHKVMETQVKGMAIQDNHNQTFMGNLSQVAMASQASRVNLQPTPL